MKIYAGAVVTFYHSGKTGITPVYMNAVSWQHAMKAAYTAIKSVAGYDATVVRENQAALEEITPEWLAKSDYFLIASIPDKTNRAIRNEE